MCRFALWGLLVLTLGLVVGCGGSDSTTNNAGVGGSGHSNTGGSGSNIGGSGHSNTGGSGNSVTGGATSTTTSGSCGTFSACGGSLDGTWQLDDTCIAGDLLAEMTAELPSACSGLLTSVTQNVSGTVTFANGIESNNVTSTVTETAVYTSACLTALAGQSMTIDAALCAQIQSDLQDGQTSTCTFSGGNCNCSIVMTSTDTTSSPYTISGHTIETSGGDTMDYCVTGTTMKAAMTPTDTPSVTIYYSMHKTS